MRRATRLELLDAIVRCHLRLKHKVDSPADLSTLLIEADWILVEAIKAARGERMIRK